MPLSGCRSQGRGGLGPEWDPDGVGALPLLDPLLFLQLWGKREDHSSVHEAVERREGGSKRLMGSLLLQIIF